MIRLFEHYVPHVVLLLATRALLNRTLGVGLFDRGFDIIELRSRRQDAEVGDRAVWAAERDPRATRIGCFIRKVRIDEPPQCWTVLKGEMSFVGPRPERPLPFYAERHMVKPGSTGRGRSTIPMARRSRMRATSVRTTSTTPRIARPSSTSSSCSGRCAW